MRSIANRPWLFHVLLTFIASTAVHTDIAQQPSLQRHIHIVAFQSDYPIQDLALSVSGKSYPIPRGPNPSVGTMPTITIEDGNPNWIRDLSITIQNKSVKPIVAIEIMVYVLSWERDIHHMSHYAYFHEGQLPNRALRIGDGPAMAQESSMILDIEPGTAKDIPLRQAHSKLDAIKPSSIASLASVDSIWIQPQRIYFADGTKWEFGTYQKPDRSTSSRYVTVTRAEWESYADQ